LQSAACLPTKQSFSALSPELVQKSKVFSPLPNKL
jgi:hypothetical protein